MKRIVLGLMLAAAAMSAGANNATMTKSFKDLDTNGDGKLSQSEISAQKALAADFSKADVNGDGKLSQSEYNAWTSAHPTSPMPSSSTSPSSSSPNSTTPNSSTP